MQSWGNWLQAATGVRLIRKRGPHGSCAAVGPTVPASSRRARTPPARGDGLAKRNPTADAGPIPPSLREQPAAEPLDSFPLETRSSTRHASRGHVTGPTGGTTGLLLRPIPIARLIFPVPRQLRRLLSELPFQKQRRISGPRRPMYSVRSPPASPFPERRRESRVPRKSPGEITDGVGGKV